MSEIRFACPHCQQHIACDAGYVDMCIVCPTCGKPMVVPVLTASENPHTGTCIVASVPTPKRRLTSRIPTLDLWGAEEWEARLQQADNASAPTMPLWVVTAFITLFLAVFLQAFSAGPAVVIACVVLGTVLSAVLFSRGETVEAGHSIFKVLGFALLLIVAIPVIAVGVLFIGCCAIR